MPLLAYCTLENVPNISIPGSGVQGQPILAVQHSGLQCLLSQFKTAASARNEAVRDSALAFNRFLQSVFEQTAIIPFRFPTLVNEQPEIVAYLRQHESELSAALKNFRGMAQMEISAQMEGAPRPSSHQSGKAYLRSRQSQLAMMEKFLSELRQVLSPFANEWRIRESADRVRCYVLVRRDAVEDFSQRAKTIELPPQIRARITGPWPVSEFVSET